MDSIKRAIGFENFFIHLSSSWEKLETAGDKVIVQSRGEGLPFDHLILATGFSVDPVLRLELSQVAPNSALWKDVY